MVSFVQDITPEIAAKWLATSKGNRGLNKLRLGRMVQDIKAGKWEITNQGIGFDEFGSLVDGHHRLQAIILAGMVVKSLVVMGILRQAVPRIDVGSPRSPGHILLMNYGIPNASRVAACARIFCALEDNAQTLANTKASLDAERWNRAYFENKDAFTLGAKVGMHFSATLSGNIAFAYKINPALVSDFAEKILSKIGIEANSPENATLKSIKLIRGDSSQVHQMKLFATAMYFKLRGAPVLVLRENETALEWLREERKKAGKTLMERLK